jgi:flagellum-specific peptidoglycan hydrolase FlgJ
MMATPEEQKAFISKISGAAQMSMGMTHVPASFTVAEGALESAWGTSGLVDDAMNIFGVKADSSWHGEVFTMRTREYIKGRWIIEDAKWRKYTSWLACINDHAQFFLQNERYKSCFQYKDGPGFARAVAAAGYATDPDYADKIITIINDHYLAALDNLKAGPVVAPPVSVVPPVVAKPTVPVPAPTPTPAPSAPQKTGFLAWLKKLF